MPIENDKVRDFFVAARAGDISQVKKLLYEGVSIDSVHWDGETALSEAVLCGNVDVANFLIQNGADLKIKDSYGWPLLMSSRLRSYKIVDLLLQSGCDPNEGDPMYSPLLVAVLKGYVDIVKLLLDYGADPNFIDCEGDDVLAIAKFKWKERDEDIGKKGKGENEFLEIVDFLRQKGAIDTNITTYREKTRYWGKGPLYAMRDMLIQ